MPKKRKFVSIDDKCRVCLCDEGCMSDIFSDDLRQKITELGKSASISIDDEETLPKNICHVCRYKLDMWIDFKEQLIRSDALLREHLELSLLDNKVSSAKRKHSDVKASPENDSVTEADVKKLKSASPMPVPVDCVNSDIKAEKEANSDEKPVIQEPQKDTTEKIKSPEIKEDSEISSDVIALPCESSTKVKQIAGRRAKTTERRKESTRRWVARKKALLAATGENDTDTDSMGSNDDQLSPVQKARAKCNAEKVIETNRRVTRGTHNLEGKMCGPYAPNGSSDANVNRASDSEKDKTNCTIKTETPIDGSGDARLSSQANKSAVESKNPKVSLNITSNFAPQSVRSELIVNGETFVITSTLLLSEPHHLNAAESAESPKPIDEANQQRNTDIIDAVQLRRVNPKNSTHKNDKFVDTCLNIEVEGTELEALQRVQTVLASFVENEMRSKLLDGEIVDVRAKETFQTLDQQLKTIVEKTIRKNLENTKLSDNRGENTFVGEFMRAAMRSKIFQPRVLLVRCDENRVANSYNRKLRKRKTESEKITTKARKKCEEPPIILGKRRSVQPAKYADYNTSSLPTESERMELNEVFKKPVVVGKCNKFKTYGPAPVKFPQTSAAVQQKVQKSLVIPANAVIIQKSTSNTSKTASAATANNSTGEKHICGVCGEYFDTRKEVENHVVVHRKPPKQKLMRCKRCHEIVEARFVKLHVCSASKNPHKCRSCNATFRTEQLLARHEESHDQEQEIQLEENSIPETTQNPEIPESTEIAEDKNPLLAAIAQDRDSYTCFVCDKTFTDEELLKDHLQKHCDDISEDEQSNEKEFQCAICGESLNSEDALGAHVEKHLFDDEDDNPNLISITRVDTDNKSGKPEMIHSCGQCSENFDSEMLLMLHMQAHEEEVAIAEWERRGIDNAQEEQHTCVICDDVFATEDELSEHLDIHNGNAHICQLCDKPFLTLEELQSHVNTH